MLTFFLFSAPRVALVCTSSININYLFLIKEKTKSGDANVKEDKDVTIFPRTIN